MTIVSTVGVSSAVAINPRSRSFQFNTSHLSSTTTVLLPTVFYSPSSLSRVSCAELHLHNGSPHSRSFHSSKRGLNSTNLWYDLVHIAAGDLLRAEIAADTENEKLAKEYMEKGMLVSDEIQIASMS